MPRLRRKYLRGDTRRGGIALPSRLGRKYEIGAIVRGFQFLEPNRGAAAAGPAAEDPSTAPSAAEDASAAGSAAVNDQSAGLSHGHTLSPNPLVPAYDSKQHQPLKWNKNSNC